MEDKPERIATSVILCGINGTGKTTLLRNILTEMMKSGQRALIVTPDPLEWSGVKEVNDRNKSEISTFEGARKIIYYKGCMELIQKYYYNGILVFDDARVYIRAQSDDFMTWLQIRRRQAGIDLFTVTHGLTQVPPIFFTFASTLILFYTKDNIKRRGDYVDEADFEEIQQAKKRISQIVTNGNKYYYEIIKLDKRI